MKKSKAKEHGARRLVHLGRERGGVGGIRGVK
jgi:hypothetical protein